MGMRLIRHPSPSGLWTGTPGIRLAWPRFPIRRIFVADCPREDECRGGKGESGPESGRSPERSLLSPLCLEQSRVSPGEPVG